MTASATRTSPATHRRSPTAPRTGGAPAGDGGPAGGAHLKRRAGPIGSFRLQQLVLFEIAVALPLCAWVAERSLSVPAGAAAAALAVLAVVRLRRRSLPEWLRAVLALRARTRRAASTAPPTATEPGIAPAVACEPALRTHVFSHRDRRPVGMIGDGTFLTVVLRVDADGTALRADRSARPLPLTLVREALEVDGIRLESAQIVQHTRPAPAVQLPRQSVAARNYAPLQARTGAPAVRITWIALKLNPELCPGAVRARGGGLGGAQKCLVRVADHLAGRLGGAGFRATVLTEQELGSAVTTAACADRAGDSHSTAPRTRETRRTWECDGRPHTTYWVGRWPQLGAGGAPMARLVALLTSVPALATTFSLTLARGGRQELTLTGHLRITGRDEEQLQSAREELQHTARGVRTSLVPLDREQLPGVLATLPLGGTR